MQRHVLYNSFIKRTDFNKIADIISTIRIKCTPSNDLTKFLSQPVDENEERIQWTVCSPRNFIFETIFTNRDFKTELKVEFPVAEATVLQIFCCHIYMIHDTNFQFPSAMEFSLWAGVGFLVRRT